MLVKEFKNYYSDGIVRNIAWTFDPLQAFLNIFKAFNDLSRDFLHMYFQYRSDGVIGSTTQNTRRTGYFQDGFHLHRDNSFQQEPTNRSNSSMFYVRHGESLPSFRDYSVSRNENRHNTSITIEDLLPSRRGKAAGVRRASETPARSRSPLKNLKDITKVTAKLNESSRRASVLSKITARSGKNTSRDIEEGNKSKSEVRVPKGGNERQKSVDNARVNNPQSLERALKEVDMNCVKKLLNKETLPSERKKVTKIEKSLEQAVEPFLETSAVQEEAHVAMGDVSYDSTSNLPSKNVANSIPVKMSKPPLKGSHFYSSKGKKNTSLNYESFNPRFYEKQQTLESDTMSSVHIKEKEIHLTSIQAKGKTDFMAEESLSEKAPNISNIIEVNKKIEDNKKAWQNEKGILENVVQRRSSQGYFKDENDPENIGNIITKRRGSIVSEKSPTRVVAEDGKSLKNIDIMEILNKLESKIYEGKLRPSNAFEEKYSSGSFMKVVLTCFVCY